MIPYKPPTQRQLRLFGIALTTLLLGVAGLLTWKWQATTAAIVVAIFAVALLVVYSLVPSTREPIYAAFRRLTYPIQWLATGMILAVVYVLLITPIGGLLRLKGITVRKKIHADQDSYWIAVEDATEPSRYFDTF